MNDATDKLSNTDLIAALEARKETLSPADKARLSAIAVVQETRGDVGSTVGGGRTAPLSAEAAATAPEKLARLSQVITTQYAEWTQGVDGNRPTPEQVLASFRPEQLEVANTYATPYLLMMPVPDDKDPDKITGYEPVIAEGKPEIDPYGGDDIRANLENRISAREEARRTGESGMTKNIWNRLFQAVKKAGQMIDARFYTMLEDDYSEGDPVVPFALSFRGRPLFGRNPAGDPGVGTRFRSSVRGNVLSI